MADASALLDVTVGGNTASSYISLEEADHYHTNHRSQNTEWFAVTDVEKRRHILWAMSSIETYFKWKGTKATTRQSLEWPRYRAYDDNKYLIGYDYTLSVYTIPTQVKNAVSEMAYQLMIGNSSAGTTPQELTGLKIDVIELKFNEAATDAKSIPDVIREMLMGVGSLKTTKVSTATLVRT